MKFSTPREFNVRDLDGTIRTHLITRYTEAKSHSGNEIIILENEKGKIMPVTPDRIELN